MPAIDRRPLLAVLALALLLRGAAAFWPNIHHPDETYQYLEPAWRMLGHDGVVTWEWRYGMRSWLLPTLFAPIMALGLAIDPSGDLPYLLPRLAAAGASLAIVAAAWGFGARVSRTHAIVAAAVAAIWFEFVYFAPHTLSEPLSAAAILPAALLLTHDAPSRRALAIAGALLGLGFLFRFQHAPAIAMLVALAAWRDWRVLPPLVAGGVAALAIGALADIAQGAPSLAWIWINVEQNLVHDRAADFGVSPATAYIGELWAVWNVALIALLLAVRQGWRHCPPLLWAALANLIFLSLIGHKEYRFLFVSVAMLVILAALGSADWIARARRHGWRFALPAGLAGWAALSLTLVATERAPLPWQRGIGGERLFAAVRTDPAACGVALVDLPFYLFAGQFRAGAGVPIQLVIPEDPAVADLAVATRAVLPAASHVVAPQSRSALLPPTYRPARCADVGGVATCLYVRAGGCTAGAGPFAINATLTRLDR